MRGSRGARTVATMQNGTPKATPVDPGKPVKAPGEDSIGSGVWARAFAVLYDPFLWVGERAGLRAQREELLSRARGGTVEIGGGTGLNLPHYPNGLDELVLVEPDAAMRVRLEKRLGRSRRRARVVDAPAERLPFADGSVDTVVSTFVLRTVDAPDLALREIARVLRPDGQLLFIEHVRSESPTLVYWQDRLERPWRQLRGRLPLQPRDGRADRDPRARARTRERSVVACDAADRATPHRQPGVPGERGGSIR